MQFSKILFETTRPRAFIFGIQHYQEVLYQNCSNGCNWLYRQVTGSKNRFSKCHFQKSPCLKLQGPELSYLVYSIIQRSSTKIVQIMPLVSKLTPPQGSQFYIELYKENLLQLNLSFSKSHESIYPFLRSNFKVPNYFVIYSM